MNMKRFLRTLTAVLLLAVLFTCAADAPFARTPLNVRRGTVVAKRAAARRLFPSHKSWRLRYNKGAE